MFAAGRDRLQGLGVPPTDSRSGSRRSSSSDGSSDGKDTKSEKSDEVREVRLEGVVRREEATRSRRTPRSRRRRPPPSNRRSAPLASSSLVLPRQRRRGRVAVSGKDSHGPPFSSCARASRRGRRRGGGHRGRGRVRPGRAAPSRGRPRTGTIGTRRHTRPAGRRHARRAPTSPAAASTASQLPAGVLARLAPTPWSAASVAVAGPPRQLRRRSATSRRGGAPGLDGVVPRGMRAIRIVVSDALRPRPGAAVDVLASYDARSRRRRRAHRVDGGGRSGRDACSVPTHARAGAPGGRRARRDLLVEPEQAELARRRAGQRRAHARAGTAGGAAQ